MDRLNRTELQLLEYEAHRLRVEYAHDLVVWLAVNIDLAVRKLACRLALA